VNKQTSTAALKSHDRCSGGCKLRDRESVGVESVGTSKFSSSNVWKAREDFTSLSDIPPNSLHQGGQLPCII